MRSILYASGERPGVAEAVANAIVQNWQPVNMAHMIEGDIVSEEVMCAMMHQHRSVGIPQSGVERLVAPLWTATFLDANEYHLLNYQYRIYKSLKRPYLDAKREIDAIVKEVEGKSGNPSYTYASIWVPTYAKLLDKQAQDEALAANVRAGALVLAYRAQHGHFPERLDEVLSPVPVDPFSGQPLRYRFENGSKGFVVYSVGPTGGFDGGTPERGPDHNREALFRYPLPVYLQK